jgi:lauroyl/myristoyl acyltransferase
VALYFALRIGSWIVPYLPVRLAHSLAMWVGTLAYVVAWPARRTVQRNLTLVLGLAPTHPRLRWVALRCFQNNAKNWVDTLRLDRLSAADILQIVRVEGWEHLERALGAGHGAILVGLHLGNIDLVGQVIVARGYRLVVPVEAMQPPPLFRLVQSQRRSRGLETVPVNGVARTLLRVLQENGIVGIMCDRNLSENGVTVNFFGHPTMMPKGPAWLARHSNAPLLIGVGIRQQDDTFIATIMPPLPLQCTDNATHDIYMNTQILTTALEPLIVQHPEQWVLFAPLITE